VSVHVALVFLIDLEVPALLEGRVEGEHHVQGLDDGVVLTGMDGDVQNVAGHATVVRQGQVDLLTGSSQIVKQLLHLRRPDLHQRVDVRHVLRVAHRGRLLDLLHIRHRVDPLHDLLGVLLGTLDAVHVGRLAALGRLAVVPQLEVDFSRIRLIQSWFVLAR
jgi:hypothetical protein